mmetsp:Transcript_124365/g.398251  ORF Transcript_124365/g.398251 Transcript_124365/m.398251 type:complete len:335 (+) Transcript_124365:183-1187(+)
MEGLQVRQQLPRARRAALHRGLVGVQHQHLARGRELTGQGRQADIEEGGWHVPGTWHAAVEEVRVSDVDGLQAAVGLREVDSHQPAAVLTAATSGVEGVHQLLGIQAQDSRLATPSLVNPVGVLGIFVRGAFHQDVVGRRVPGLVEPARELPLGRALAQHWLLLVPTVCRRRAMVQARDSGGVDVREIRASVGLLMSRASDQERQAEDRESRPRFHLPGRNRRRGRSTRHGLIKGMVCRGSGRADRGNEDVCSASLRRHRQRGIGRKARALIRLWRLGQRDLHRSTGNGALRSGDSGIGAGGGGSIAAVTNPVPAVFRLDGVRRRRHWSWGEVL